MKLHHNLVAMVAVAIGVLLVAGGFIGCAGARTHRDGTFDAFAIGDASVEKCIEPVVAPVDPAAPRPRVCVTVKGGVVSTGLVSGAVAILGGGMPWQ